jgi:hypothetical protein
MCATRAADGRKLREEQHLALANRHIAETKERIERQSARVGRMAAAGWDTSLSERLLREMERARELMSS